MAEIWNQNVRKSNTTLHCSNNVVNFISVASFDKPFKVIYLIEYTKAFSPSISTEKKEGERENSMYVIYVGDLPSIQHNNISVCVNVIFSNTIKAHELYYR
jgi:hypothetical protein